MTNIEEKVYEIVCEHMGASRDKLAPETSFINDLGADSLDTVELVMEFESALDCKISKLLVEEGTNNIKVNTPIVKINDNHIPLPTKNLNKENDKKNNTKKIIDPQNDVHDIDLWGGRVLVTAQELGISFVMIAKDSATYDICPVGVGVTTFQALDKKKK
mgnify:CR=1 FL=1